MNKKNVTTIIVSKLNKIKKIDKINLKNIDDFDFISFGHIDSIEILKFIFEIENKFKISFKPADTVSRNFKTVKGLRSLILKKLSKIS
jgi:acyl carrier protein